MNILELPVLMTELCHQCVVSLLGVLSSTALLVGSHVSEMQCVSWAGVSVDIRPLSLASRRRIRQPLPVSNGLLSIRLGSIAAILHYYVVFNYAVKMFGECNIELTYMMNSIGESESPCGRLSVCSMISLQWCPSFILVTNDTIIIKLITKSSITIKIDVCCLMSVCPVAVGPMSACPVFALPVQPFN